MEGTPGVRASAAGVSSGNYWANAATVRGPQRGLEKQGAVVEEAWRVFSLRESLTGGAFR